jgi:hypothetical protein
VVAHQHVDPSEGLDGRGHQLLGRLGPGQVHAQPASADVPQYLVHGIRAPRLRGVVRDVVLHEQLGTQPAQPGRDRVPDPLPPAHAGDQRD